VSETEWYASDSIDGLPDARNAKNFITAIAPLAIRAAITTDLFPAIVHREGTTRLKTGDNVVRESVTLRTMSCGRV
jgi:hypothetical protein